MWARAALRFMPSPVASVRPHTHHERGSTVKYWFSRPTTVGGSATGQEAAVPRPLYLPIAFHWACWQWDVSDLRSGLTQHGRMVVHVMACRGCVAAYSLRPWGPFHVKHFSPFADTWCAARHFLWRHHSLDPVCMRR